MILATVGNLTGSIFLAELNREQPYGEVGCGTFFGFGPTKPENRKTSISTFKGSTIFVEGCHRKDLEKLVW